MKSTIYELIARKTHVEDSLMNQTRPYLCSQRGVNLKYNKNFVHGCTFGMQQVIAILILYFPSSTELVCFNPDTF